MTLEVAIEFDDRAVALEFTVPPQKTLAVVGPNGSGKTTLIESLAGLLEPDRGRIVHNGVTFFASQPRAVWVPAHRRKLALLAQQPLLFAHLNVLENVAFGSRSLGRSRGEARAIASRELERVTLGGLAQRKPAEVSGGQAQRIALARALAADPALLLLDEPLASVDREARTEIRAVLRDALVGRTAVMVTHDIADASELADELLVLDAGRIAQQGSVAEVIGAPGTLFAANLVSGAA